MLATSLNQKGQKLPFIVHIKVGHGAMCVIPALGLQRQMGLWNALVSQPSKTGERTVQYEALLQRIMQTVTKEDL